jgi:hypothetical protein
MPRALFYQPQPARIFIVVLAKWAQESCPAGNQSAQAPCKKPASIRYQSSALQHSQLPHRENGRVYPVP